MTARAIRPTMKPTSIIQIKCNIEPSVVCRSAQRKRAELSKCLRAGAWQTSVIRMRHCNTPAYPMLEFRAPVRPFEEHFDAEACAAHEPCQTQCDHGHRREGEKAQDGGRRHHQFLHRCAEFPPWRARLFGRARGAQ